MNILVLGSGGREHAISWKISQSELCKNLFIAPGNAGTNLVGSNINLDINNFEKVKEFVLDKSINLVIVGPEEPLVKGIVDFFKLDEELKNVNIFGPGKSGAMLEGSKDFSKEFMFRNKIPCGKSKTFSKNNLIEGFKFLDDIKPPYVLKADGHKHDIVDTAVKAGAFNTLVAAVQAADLVDTLKGMGPFTVFAPTDDAFALIDEATLNDLLKPENKSTLAGILTYHVLSGKVMSGDISGTIEAVTVNGQKLIVKAENGKVFVNDAEVITADIETTNGVIHVINKVVLPQ